MSEVQLAAATERMRAHGVRFPLVQGAAEHLPFAPASFDVVFCDHGGLSWAPPHLAAPQVARVLRGGAGLMVEDLIEPRPDPGANSSYMQADPPDWARRWPAEMLWIARKP